MGPHSLLVALMTEQPKLRVMYRTTSTLKASVVSSHRMKLIKVSRITCVQKTNLQLALQEIKVKLDSEAGDARGMNSGRCIKWSLSN